MQLAWQISNPTSYWHRSPKYETLKRLLDTYAGVVARIDALPARPTPPWTSPPN
ncbi:hypothetical protein ACWGDS_43475 [Streptomyces sp. NPDC055059]